MRRLPPYCTHDFDRHGNERFWVQRKGCRKIRIREEPGSKAFMTAYSAALVDLGLADPTVPPALRPAPKPRPRRDRAGPPETLRELTDAYMASGAFRQKLSQRTQRVRRRTLERICERNTKAGAERGDQPWRALEPRHVAKWRDELADRPEAANGMIKALRQVFAWAKSAEAGFLATSNPAAEIGYIVTDSDGHHSWTPDEVDRYCARHPVGTKARLAFDLLYYTAQRRSDVVLMGRQHERDGGLLIKQAKGRKGKRRTLWIDIPAPLRASIDATGSGHLAYLVTAFGQPFTSNGFGNWFRKRCREAGLPPRCTAHGLRKARAAYAAERGGTEEHLKALGGWENSKNVAIYTRAARQKVLARELARMLDEEQTGDQSITPPESGVIPGEERE